MPPLNLRHVIAALSLLATPAFAATRTLSAAHDTTISSQSPDNNNGAAGSILTGRRSASGSRMRGLIRFTMPASLEDRVTVTSAVLTMYTEVMNKLGEATETPFESGQPTAATVSLKLLSQTWDEGNGVVLKSGSTTQANSAGEPCTTITTSRGATWTYANCKAATGDWAGGTTVHTSDSASVARAVPPRAITWSSSTMNADVQGWIDSPSTNFGWLITSNSEGNTAATTAQAQRFYSSEGSVSSRRPALAITYSCKSGFAASGLECTACTSAMNTACHVGGGNTCNNPAAPAPATSVSCTCGNPAYANGPLVGGRVQSCVDRDACVGNPCDNNGDTTATCIDAVAPAAGYTCDCTEPGFKLNAAGTACIGSCTRQPTDPVPSPVPATDPCGNGGYCAITGAGTWSCTCPVGYVSTTDATPGCVQLDACDAAAQTRCTSEPGNGCVDEAPPSIDYTCDCANPAYVLGTIAGKAACVNKNECAPTDHCVTEGDTGATCVDDPPPGTSYTCGCSPQWTAAIDSGGFETCVDADECAAGAPCGHGVCTNLLDGGGYSCVCDPGYVVSGPQATPTCLHPDGCNATAGIACVTYVSGNACVDDEPPQIGYRCDCSHPAYAPSVDHRSCVDRNACLVNHCGDEGDRRADCVDRAAPQAGYDCGCSEGFAFDGVTCVDRNECAGGSNPCGHGRCSNTLGGYECTCDSGFVSSGAPHPTCKGGNRTFLQVTTEAGCGAVGAPPAASVVSALLAVLALLLARRARPRS